MSDKESFHIDFVRELRLRKWARQHWVSQETRKLSWHPIVLNEMSLRDRELAEQLVTENAIEQVAVIDTSANEQKTRGDLIAPITDFHYSDTESVRLNIGSAYVPLPPTTNWELHEGTAEIPKPHYGRVKSDLREYAEFRTW